MKRWTFWAAWTAVLLCVGISAAHCQATVRLNGKTYSEPQYPYTDITLQGMNRTVGKKLSDVVNVMDFATGGVCNDAAFTGALAKLTSLGGGKLLFPSGGVCTFTGSFVIPSGLAGNVYLDLAGATLNFSGTGGGACTQGVNGLISVGYGEYVYLFDGTIRVTNAALDCIVNHSVTTTTGDGFAQGLHIDRVSFMGVAGVTTARAIYTVRSGNWSVENSIFYNGFRNSIVSDSGAQEQTDIVTIRHNTFGPTTAKDYNIKIAGSQAVNITGNNFENAAVQMTTTGYNIAMSTVQENSVQDGCDALFDFENAGVVVFKGNFQYSGACSATIPFVNVVGGLQFTGLGNYTFGAGVGFQVTGGAHATLQGNAIQSATFGIAGGGIYAHQNTITSATDFNLTAGGNDIGQNALTIGSGGAYFALNGTTQNHIEDPNVINLLGFPTCTTNILQSAQYGYCVPGLYIPNIKAVTGMRFVCVDTNGTVSSSATACSGT